MANILVVEDDRDMCKVISDILKEEGYLVDIAYDPELAMRKIKRKKYHLMILDYKLPGSSGLIVLEEAKQIRPKLRVMMISAYGNEYVKAKAKELGSVNFLDKPFDVKKTVKNIKKILSNKKR